MLTHKSFLLYVCHSSDHPSTTELAKALRISNEDDYEIIVVNTMYDFRVGNAVVPQEEVNRFFEFSGYEVGLKKILSQYDFELANILFFNSTILVPPSILYLYRTLFQLTNVGRNRSSNQSFISGLVSNRKGYSFIPTCFFELSGSRDALSNFSFIPNWLQKSFFSIDQLNFYDLPLFVGNSADYHARQENWLNPRGFLRGWYKAPYFERISECDFRRKVVTIFLEHDLLRRNDSFSIFDLGRSSRFIYLLEMANRIRVLLFKIYFRTRFLFSRGYGQTK